MSKDDAVAVAFGSVYASKKNESQQTHGINMFNMFNMYLLIYCQYVHR